MVYYDYILIDILLLSNAYVRATHTPDIMLIVDAFFQLCP